MRGKPAVFRNFPVVETLLIRVECYHFAWILVYIRRTFPEKMIMLSQKSTVLQDLIVNAFSEGKTGQHVGKIGQGVGKTGQ